MLQGDFEYAAVNAFEWLGGVGFPAFSGNTQRPHHVQPHVGGEFFEVLPCGLQPLNGARIPHSRLVDKFVNVCKAKS